MIGERLRIARRKSGLSLRDVADRMGGQVTHTAISKYERDEMAPSSAVLIELTKVLDVSLEFLAAPMAVRLGSLEFRKKSGTSAQERAVVEATVLEHVERYLMVEDALDLDSAHWKAPFKPEKVQSFEEAEAVANKARKEWNLGEAPLPDITELLEERGIKVVLLPLPEAVSGLTCLVERPDQPPVPVIVVNSTYTLERRRFTLLHELGHRLMRVEDIDEEKAAHRFASAFLMPAAHLRETVGKRRHGFGIPELYATKRLYGVAASALIVRFRDLGIISQEQLVALFQTTARTWRKREPQPMPMNLGIEKPRRFRRLCYRALAEKLISVTKAADLLQEPVALIAKEMRGEEPPEDCRQ